MIKFESKTGEIEIDCQDVSHMMQEASMLIMAITRQVQKELPGNIPADFIVQDLFKSLRYAALLEDGKSEDEAMELLVPESEDEQDLPEIQL